MQIIPAILEESYEEIEERAESVPEAVSIHVDICDGIFVDHQTWPYAYLKSPDLDQDDNIHQLFFVGVVSLLGPSLFVFTRTHYRFLKKKPHNYRINRAKKSNKKKKG